MSTKSRSGKAAWAVRAATYQEDLTKQITKDAQARMDEWSIRGRVPARVRIMARITGRPLRLPDDENR